jgi:hypothetical protein
MKRFLLSMVVACGGHVVDFSDSATMDSGVMDAPKDVIAVDVPTPVDCNALDAQLIAARKQILTCCPICQTPQCTHVTNDVCCPISTTATNVSAFEALVAQYVAQCHPTCPGAPCPPAPSNTCVPGATMNDPGTCK